VVLPFMTRQYRRPASPRLTRYSEVLYIERE